MKIAAFNVENLFDRPKAFNLEDHAKGAAITDAVAELNQLIAQGDNASRARGSAVSGTSARYSAVHDAASGQLVSSLLASDGSAPQGTVRPGDIAENGTRFAFTSSAGYGPNGVQVYRAPQPTPAHAFSWGGLTSGGWWKALWLLLLPFVLINADAAQFSFSIAFRR